MNMGLVALVCAATAVFCWALMAPRRPRAAGTSGTAVGEPDFSMEFWFTAPKRAGALEVLRVHALEAGTRFPSHAVAVYLDDERRLCVRLRPAGRAGAGSAPPAFGTGYRESSRFALLRSLQPVRLLQRVAVRVHVAKNAAHLYVDQDLQQSVLGLFSVYDMKRYVVVQSEPVKSLVIGG